MRHALFSFVLLFAMLTAFSAPRAADITLVTGNEYPPFTDENLPEGGLSAEIVKRVFQDMGDTTSITYMPWKRGYESTKNGAFSGTFPYVRRADRERDFWYSLPINQITQLVYVRKDFQIDFQELGDLKGMTKCRARGYAQDPEFEPLVQSGDIQEVITQNVEQCYLMLKHHRADFIVLNQYVGWANAMGAVGDDAKSAFKTLPKALVTENLHFIVPRTLPQGEDLISRFNASLSALREQNVIQTVEKKHLQAFWERRD